MIHPYNVLQRERRVGQRSYRDRQQEDGIVVRRDPVGRQRAAAAAAVDDRPFPALPDPDADRFHDAAAFGGAIARCSVEMEAMKTVGTVVPMRAARTLRGHGPPALTTNETG